MSLALALKPSRLWYLSQERKRLDTLMQRSWALKSRSKTRPLKFEIELECCRDPGDRRSICITHRSVTVRLTIKEITESSACFRDCWSSRHLSSLLFVLVTYGTKISKFPDKGWNVNGLSWSSSIIIIIIIIGYVHSLCVQHSLAVSTTPWVQKMRHYIL